MNILELLYCGIIMNSDQKDTESYTLLGKEFLEKSFKQIDSQKKLAEKAINQVKDDKKLNVCIDGESNSIAIIIKHLEGNMRSRWTDFLISDGEKLERHRPQEFDRTFKPSREELMKIWNNGWNIFYTSFHQLTPDDLMKTIYIRKEPLTVMDAILRQLNHYSTHIGQILFLAKHLEWQNWKHVTLERDAEVFDAKDIKK